MSINSSPTNDSVSFNNSELPSLIRCLFTGPIFFIFITYNIIDILLLLPLCIFILHHGLQQWMKKRSTSSASTMSHCDCFTYHLVAMELVGVIGRLLSCCGVYWEDRTIIHVGRHFTSLTWFGEMFFHVLTCGEPYLAVVHPVTYLSLRRERGVRLRNISVVCAWLLCFVGTGLKTFEKHIIFLNFSLLILSSIVVSFCSLSVLRVLIGPGPGEQGGGWERVDQSKKRAFYTIVVILGVLVLKFAGNIVLGSLYFSKWVPDCGTIVLGEWFNLPSSLVLPLLFIQREGKLSCRKTNI